MVEPEFAAVERRAGWLEVAAGAFYGDAAILLPYHFSAECGGAAQAAGTVRAGRKIGEARGAAGQCSQQGIAVRDALIAGQAQTA